MKSILTIIGTRPEAIKLIPVLKNLESRKIFKSYVCVTQQHYHLDKLLEAHSIASNFILSPLETHGSLHMSASHILKHLGKVMDKLKLDLVMVQGDTTTAFIGALSAFYLRIPVAHIEAGLRTHDLYSPWPEEAHRILIDKISTYFFAPTVTAKKFLIAEGIAREKIWIVGNTSIDALKQITKSSKTVKSLEARKILVTIHRREHHEEALIQICEALRTIAVNFKDVHISFVLHPNPAIQSIIRKTLGNFDNLDLMEPLDHPSFINLMQESLFIITDSGGVQEEASFLGKPVLIVRDNTERDEIIKNGTAILVGTKSNDIIKQASLLLKNPETLLAMSKIHLPYGKGNAAKRIVNILHKELNKANPNAL